jgi:penicillin-binding protein 1C
MWQRLAARLAPRHLVRKLLRLGGVVALALRRHARKLWLLTGVGVLALLALDAARLDLRGPAPSYLLLDRNGRFIAELNAKGEEFGYWPLAELPPRVLAATQVLEDRRFDRHPGVDVLAVGRALVQNITQHKRVSGASTIAMQVARLLEPGERTYWHKLREAWHAVVLTARFGRKDVLSAYLRLAPYGNRMHGIAYAARRYLEKPVEDLSWAEIALLSAIPQAPTQMNPFHEDGRKRAIARGTGMLAQLRANSVLSAAEYEMALQQIRDIHLPAISPRPAHSLHAVFKLEQVLAAAAPRTGPEPYRIVTTLDLELQQNVADLAGEALAEWQGKGAGNVAAVLLDRESNGVLAWLGSADYFDRGQSGALDFARTPRSPGSALKPFFYAQALERGVITPATILDDLPSLGDGIVNADKTYLGPLLPRQALANSRNVPAARLLNELGLDEGYGFLQQLELHRNEHTAQYYGLGLVIGTMPVTLEHLVQAYSVLANDGRWRSLKFYPGQPGEVRQLLSPGVARLVTLQLSDPAARLPAFPRMGTTEYAFPVALKTGSSQGLRDAWTVAYSRRYLVGVWVGHPDARPMRDVTGAGNAAELARRILKQLHRDERNGSADLSFPTPEGYQSVAICARSGKRATPACDPVFEEWFKPGQEPQQEDDAHVRLAVDVRNGLLASAATPARFVERRNFVNLAPRYAEWAAQAGLPRPPDAVSTFGVDGASGVRLAARSARAGGSGSHALHIVAPRDGLNLLHDPTLPPLRNTIALQVEVDPPIPEVLWSVDGKPYKLVAYPYTLRWPLQVGEHVMQASMPLTRERSQPIHIKVE